MRTHSTTDDDSVNPHLVIDQQPQCRKELGPALLAAEVADETYREVSLGHLDSDAVAGAYDYRVVHDRYRNGQRERARDIGVDSDRRCPVRSITLQIQRARPSRPSLGSEDRRCHTTGMWARRATRADASQDRVVQMNDCRPQPAQKPA